MPEAAGRAQAAFPACASTPTSPAFSQPPSFPECLHPSLMYSCPHPHFPKLGNTEQAFALIIFTVRVSLHPGSPNTYWCSSGDSAPRQWLRCCRCWPMLLQIPGSHEPGSRLNHRASACERHWAPVKPPLCFCPSSQAHLTST